MSKASSRRTAHAEAARELEKKLRALEEVSQTEIEKQHGKGKLTIPERLDHLFDPDTARFEIAALAASGVYEEHGDIRSAAVRTVIGSVSGQDTIVIANDSMVKSGSWFPLTIKKILRAQEIGMENRLPIIYLVDSGGLFLPLQHDSFPDVDDAGRIFYNNARISAMGVPQIAAVMGPCVAGGAYIPALCDELLMVKNTAGIFLGGPHLVQAAIGEVADREALGGSSTHTRISGMADFEDDDEVSCIARIRRLAAQWPRTQAPRPNRAAPDIEAVDSTRAADEVLDILPVDRTSPYEMRELLECLVDADSFEESKANYGKTLLTATARIKGRTLGIVASQRAVSQSAEGETQIGGVIYSDSADKAARFVLVCNQKKIPLLFIQDVTGFMVGTRAEQGGIIKDGAKLVNAVSNSRVPKITLIVGNSYGAGNYALCGRAFGPRFVIAWPSARIGVMGGSQAASTMLAIAKSKNRGELKPDIEAEISERIRSEYERTIDPYHAAARLWVDAIIAPQDTRDILDQLLRVACKEAPPEDFRLGVFQV